ncbi:hypothetical protein Tco_0531197 [Tanacetum coccineum]
MSNSNTNLQTQSSNALHNAIMEAGSKDRPPMLAPGNYVQWKSRIKRYIDTKPNSELIHYCLQNPPYTYQWAEKTVPVAKGSSETTTERYMENYKNVSQDIRDQLNAETEAVQIILTGIDNDIYSFDSFTFEDTIIRVMAISVISISLDLSEDSVGTPAGRVILFETPIIAPTIPLSPDYTPASPDYSPASDSESDPSEDPS